MARLAGVPVFLWLVIVPQADWWAVGLLIAAGLSDWLDGKLARAWNQQSRLGQVLDPAADRLYIAATLIGLAVRAIIPWRSEEHTSELQSHVNLVCRLLL